MTAFTTEMTKDMNPMDDIALDGAHFHGGLGSSLGIKRTGRELFALALDSRMALANRSRFL